MNWNEEDENRFENLIHLIEDSNEGDGTKRGFIEFINRLKSLKNKWKPSKELIMYLSDAIVIADEAEKYSVVAALKEILKQLEAL